MGVNSLPKTVTRQRRGCDFNPDPSAPESSTLHSATEPPSYMVHAGYSQLAGLAPFRVEFRAPSNTWFLRPTGLSLLPSVL